MQPQHFYAYRHSGCFSVYGDLYCGMLLEKPDHFVGQVDASGARQHGDVRFAFRIDDEKLQHHFAILVVHGEAGQFRDQLGGDGLQRYAQRHRVDHFFP